MAQGNYGSDLFSGSPYGGALGPFGAISAQSLSDFSAEITFNDLLDFTYGPNLTPANFSIPGLTVLNVYEYTAAAVRLETTQQSNVLYTCTIALSRGYFNQPLDPSLNTVTFMGNAIPATMTPVAVSTTKVRIVFAQPMLNNSALNDTLNYQVEDMFGNAFTIVSVTPEQPTNTLSVALVLSTPMHTDGVYQATISASIRSVNGQPIVPSTVPFTWVQETPNPILMQFQEFTGEVKDSVFGNPNGLVFFSPALNTSAANSIIQVEEVDVCTTAFDTYTPPQPIDPIPLYTFGRGSPVGSVLGPAGASLWAPFPRMTVAQTNVLDNRLDTYQGATDGMAVALIQGSTWNLTYVALLNNLAFLTYRPPPAAALPMPPPPSTVPITPVLFITANNLSPIPSVPSENVLVLSFKLVGESTMSATMTHTIGLHASIVAGSSMFTLPVSAVIDTAMATVEAEASIKAAGQTAMQGGSTLSATLTVGP
jgi:hypothetical protein